jgi:hypothetical protein
MTMSTQLSIVGRIIGVGPVAHGPSRIIRPACAHRVYVEIQVEVEVEVEASHVASSVGGERSRRAARNVMYRVVNSGAARAGVR